jgi:hypothetical protein
MPWLADTARIERAWLDAYHAADLPVLAAEALAEIEAPSFDIQANLAGMLSAGAFTGVHVQHGD